MSGSAARELQPGFSPHCQVVPPLLRTTSTWPIGPIGACRGTLCPLRFVSAGTREAAPSRGIFRGPGGPFDALALIPRNSNLSPLGV